MISTLIICASLIAVAAWAILGLVRLTCLAHGEVSRDSVPPLCVEFSAKNVDNLGDLRNR